ncbi:GNAT family N-acetyltransferase [Pseudoalteromonas piscicida]|uniref:GNAT family N-acetyltransferase n=1 Tax=Pseudoalteromonas piscicida TaxID=43662 RepID=A0A2A5JSZ4_PSEO7|nr:GNAT family N-acyltransferase [Pseudoalteromonas piscicida]PCK32459.1 GNAT family N-acetyltransferase [Pseudoalteromonas piscicida]
MSYRISRVNWQSKKLQLKAIRERVFVCELHIPKDVEFDQQDITAEHLIIIDDQDGPVGTGRLCNDGLLSRIAIFKSHRNREAYASLIGGLVEIAKDKGFEDIYIQCILDEVPEFLQSGFSPHGHVFMEAGIPRQRLKCPIQSINTEPFTMLH